ncbi:MAG: SLC13 family permease [Beijerinckiaceae bacterium]|nr:SLC13 family permease [Beijerinckiaceae bacterium]
MAGSSTIAELIVHHGAVISLGLTGLMLIAFVSEKLPASAVAVTGASACLMLGLVSFDQAVTAFSNKAVITIGAMLILSQALVRTGMVEVVAGWILELAESSPLQAILSMFAGALVLSAFVNSTPVVMILIPLMTVLANAVDTSHKRLLIPLSYAAILGGTCTLLGTSTNLVIDGIVRNSGLPGFGIFEITPIGLAAASAGLLYLALFGRHLLPPDDPEDITAAGQPDIITELRLGEDFSELGKHFEDLAILAPRGVRLVSVLRKGEKLDLEDEDLVSEERDRLVVRVTQEELATLGQTKNITLGVQVRDTKAEKQSVVRLTIGAGSPQIGKILRETAFISRAPVTVIGASRHHHLAGPDLRSLKLRAGDRLWISAAKEAVQSVASDRHLVVSNNPLARPFRRSRAALVAIMFAMVVGLAAAGVAPIGQLAFIGVGAMLLLKIIDAAEAWQALDMDMILLICGMLMVGMTLQETGAVRLVVDHMTPLALLLANTLGMEPKMLILTVMMGASASFATPIGYQTNTLVYKAGGYRFADFLKVGVPMNVVVGVAACTAIWFWVG